MAKRGRPAVPIGDLVTGAILTAVENDPSRDALSDREALRRSGMFTIVPTAYTLRRAMQSEYMRDALRAVLSEIAKHVYGLERWYAIDGTYLRTPYYRPFITIRDPDGDEVIRRSKSTCLIVVRGLRTGVPVALHVDNDNVSENAHFAPIFKEMIASGAIVRNGGILADAGYYDRSHYELVKSHGGRAYIDMDSDAISSKGRYPHFDEQYELWKKRDEEWYAYYDYRPLIETTNHAVKSVKRILRAQTPIARESEALALVVGYAITRLPEIRLVHGVALPFVDAAALKYIDDAVSKKRKARALGPSEIQVEREISFLGSAFRGGNIQASRLA